MHRNCYKLTRQGSWLPSITAAAGREEQSARPPEPSAPVLLRESWLHAGTEAFAESLRQCACASTWSTGPGAAAAVLLRVLATGSLMYAPRPARPDSLSVPACSLFAPGGQGSRSIAAAAPTGRPGATAQPGTAEITHSEDSRPTAHRPARGRASPRPKALAVDRRRAAAGRKTRRPITWARRRSHTGKTEACRATHFLNRKLPFNSCVHGSMPA